MPEHVAPGVYIEEIGIGPRPIAGVSTSVAGFVGRTERGPQDIREVTSWLEYQRWYGGHLGADQSFLSYAVQGFFDNGGQRCFIGRVVCQHAGRAELTLGSVRVRAIGRGSWGGRVFVRFLPTTGAVGTGEFAGIRLRIFYYAAASPGETPTDPHDAAPASGPLRHHPDVIEEYDNAALDAGAPHSLIAVVNATSRLVRLTLADGSTEVPSLGGSLIPLVVGDAVDDQPELADYLGDLEPLEPGEADAAAFGRARGLAAMELVDQVSLLLAPDQAHPSVPFADALGSALITSCESRKDRFAILSADREFSQKVDAGAGRPPFGTSFGAFYYPWIRVYDPHTRDDVFIPPSGHVAGIMARTDLEQGVHKAPANAIVIGAKGLQVPVTHADQELLNPLGVNCLRDFRADGRGIRVWGARTMTSDPEWKYINIRRLFLFLEESLNEGTQWVVFEPNAEPTWARVVRVVSTFLSTVWRNGALAGTTPDEAFFVKCDRSTMTHDDIESGRLICYVGIAPVKPAEFVLFRIGQKTADRTV